MTETLGARIAQRRKMLSMSQEAFGEKMGVSRQAISKWESDAAIPEVDRLIEMSKMFEVSVGWLLGTECNCDTLAEEPPIPIVLTPPELTTPTAEFEPAPKLPPEESEPPHSPLIWLCPICAVVAVVSLIFSILAFSRAKPEEVSAPTTPPKSYEELLEHISQLEQDLEYSNRRNEHIYERSIELMAEVENTSLLLEALKAYVYAMPNASGLIADLPEYEQFDTWNLIGDLDSTLSNIKLVFTCQPSYTHLDINQMQLLVKQGDTVVESVTCWYYPDNNMHYAECEVPPANDYRYEVKILYKTGLSEQFELTGHKMSDLLDAMQPQIQSASRESNSHVAQGAINIRYEEITLSAPPLMPKSFQWNWNSMRLVHYHNGERQSEQDLSEIINALYHTGDTLSFSINNKTFSLSGSKEGDIHEIRLEGDLIVDCTVNLVDDMTYDFSMVLEKWENTGNGVFLAEET